MTSPPAVDDYEDHDSSDSEVDKYNSYQDILSHFERDCDVTASDLIKLHGGKRMRMNQSLSDTGSSWDENGDDNYDCHESEDGEGSEAYLPVERQKHETNGRREGHHSKRLSLRSPSPFHNWDSDDEIQHFITKDLSENENESQGLESDGLENAPEIDWDCYLYPNQMQPSSDWETEFSMLQASVLDNSGYHKLVISQDDILEGADDVPWYPFDPDSNFETEVGLDANGHADNNESDIQKKICYGMIHQVRVKVLPGAFKPLKEVQSIHGTSQNLSDRNLYNFHVSSDGKAPNSVFLLQPSEFANEAPDSIRNIAVLNKKTTKILSQLEDNCSFEAHSLPEMWKPITSDSAAIEKSGKPTYAFVDIILYGSEDQSTSVGNILDEQKVYLQEPDYWAPHLTYLNPHFLYLDSEHARTEEDFASSRNPYLELDIGVDQSFFEDVINPQVLLRQRTAMAFSGMTRAGNLKRISMDTRSIRTKLKLYQEEALDFIRQRESGEIQEEYCLWKTQNYNGVISCKHSITGCEKDEKPAETGGGILADEMGLGKTLTMLATIAITASKAKEFEACSLNNACLGVGTALLNSRATLVLVPSPLLLNEWIQQVKLHCVGLSKLNIYHGHGRQGNPKVLADSDIVLSTYHTISHELNDKTSPIWQMKWFRIILDEGKPNFVELLAKLISFHLAHIIRRMSTQLFKATKKLQANYYWCLTGTPVQNSPVDLAALLSFIRTSPLGNLQKFRKYIVAPMMRPTETGAENLRQILDSVCLRRTKKLLNLPETISTNRVLKFSAKEEQHYVETRDKLVSLIKQKSLQPKSSKGYLGVFQLQLKLRRLCNHGTFQKLTLGADEFDPEQALLLLKKKKVSKCEVCSKKVTGLHGIEEQRSGIFTSCGHLLCISCAPGVKANLQTNSKDDGCVRCSICSQVLTGDYLLDVGDSSRHFYSRQNNAKILSSWQYFDKAGCSTKITAVVGDIERNQTEGKSIVFSSWTRSLDLVEMFLSSRKIPYLRIDGSHTLLERKRILDMYQNVVNVRILLMTTGTGAMGLNLTVANCVYLLEPQWNPMVEYQAIARVLRLGQTRNVQVVRYIMKDTIEEHEIKSQQEQKLEYAQAGWK